MRLLDHPGGPLEPWNSTVLGNAGANCETTDGYLHPDYPSERTPLPNQSGPTINPYAPPTEHGSQACGGSAPT